MFFAIFIFGKAQTITIGNGTTYNTISGYPAPYGNYYWGARHQFIIKASEITTAGVNGAKYINSIAFNVLSPSGATLNNLEIKLRNSTLAAFPAAGSTTFQTGLTSVFGPSAFKDISGWNTHTFKTPFYWDGQSNIIVEVCFNNTGYTTNSTMYYSTVTFNASAYRYADASGNCTNTAMAVSTKRPNMRFEFISPTPPVASFMNTDTIWVNVPYTFTNTSTHNTSNYWDIRPLTATRFCNNYGCFVDSNANLTHTFTSVGTYEIALVVKGFFGVDSIKKTIHVINFYRAPKANFYLSSQKAVTPSQVFFFDSSLYGVNAWQWSINPPCIGCLTNPYQYPNTFTPDVYSQNPNFYAMDAGNFDVCLKVWNDVGADSICKQKYLNIIQGYTMCNGNDSLSNLSTAYLYDIGGPTLNYQIGLIGQCNSGFVISPSVCADSIILYVDQFRLRTTDTIQIRDGGKSNSPLIKKITGTNLPQSSKVMVARSGKMFLRMTTGSGATTAGDSGFIFHWEIRSAAKINSSSNYLCDGDSLKLTSIQNSGMNALWKLNGHKINTYSDSVCFAKDAGVYSLIVSNAGCVDSTLLNISQAPKPVPKFSINNSIQCLGTNNFLLTDTTLNNGNYFRIWNFGDNTTSVNTIFNKKYHSAGVYTVSLFLYSDKGCKDSLSQFIRVLETPASSIAISSTNNICPFDSVLLSSTTFNASKYNWYLNAEELPVDTFFSKWAKEAGMYTLKVTNNFGCDSTSSPVNVYHKAGPVTPVIHRNADTLKVSTSNNILWYLKDTLIGGANKTFYIPVKKGKYFVVVDSNSCRSTSAVFDFYFTGISSIKSSNNFLNIYPNPASNLLNVVSDSPFDYSIVDITGRTVLSSKAASNNFQIDINALSKGLYFLKAFNGEKTSIMRFEKW